MTSKYRFRIRIRTGAIVDNLMIPGRDPLEAEAKVRQIYRGCEILARDPSPEVAARLQSSIESQNAKKVVRLTKLARKVVGR
jgi:hypothetical protein